MPASAGTWSASAARACSGPDVRVETVEGSPSLATLFARAALTARGRGGDVPDRALRREGVVVDRDHLLAYQRVCRFDGGDVLPHTYPHILAFPLQVSLMADRSFPLALPGLVHLENDIRVLRTIDSTDRLDLTVHATDLRSHPKGSTVDLVTEVDVAGERVWEGRSTYLRRTRAHPDAAPRPPAPSLPDRPAAGVVRLPEGLGRSYASVSGDVNPIHLHPLTARAMGFPRAIAHGMWTYARTLAVLGSAPAHASRSHVWFQKPVLLPSTVEVVAHDTGAAAVLGLRSAKDATVHHLVLTLSRA